MVQIVVNGEECNAEEAAAYMDEYFTSMQKEQKSIAQQLQVSMACAGDIMYLRTRTRWTQELENELISLHKAGTPPNVMEFGVTPQTQQRIREQVEALIAEHEDAKATRH